MANTATTNTQNPFREYLYNLGRQDVPEFIWQWFFRYLSAGSSTFPSEPADILMNYRALFQMAYALLNSKYTSGKYSKFIKDTQTPDYTYYLVGDTHGSFTDVYTLIDYFVGVLQATNRVKIIWIGDIVDRNPYDLQNLTLILCFWILFPDNVFILRGNHEDSSVCSRYGFSQHLYDKAGSKTIFQPMWDLIIQFFSRLPLGMYCRIGPQNVWITHGGIPFDLNNYQPVRLVDIESQLNCFQAEYFDMDPYSMSILWSDPDPNLKNEHVVPNPRSGRPRFSKTAFDDFMQTNHLDCLIRGHEKWDEGYRLFFDNRLISLFSTSTYDNQPIGEAKFMRFLPDSAIEKFEDEAKGLGKGILRINSGFLNSQLHQYYQAKKDVR